MNKVVVAQLSVQENKVDHFLDLAIKMVNFSKKEKGCIAYKLLKELHKENKFFIYEKYVNEVAVENHNASDHFKNFINSVIPLLDEPPIIETF